MQHISHCSTAHIWPFKHSLDHHSPTKCCSETGNEPAGFTLTFLLPVWWFLHCFIFHVLCFFLSPKFLLESDFLFVAIQRPDSQLDFSSNGERRDGPELWVRGQSCLTRASCGTLASHLGWNKGVVEREPGELPFGAAACKVASKKAAKTTCLKLGIWRWTPPSVLRRWHLETWTGFWPSAGVKGSIFHHQLLCSSEISYFQLFKKKKRQFAT